MYKIRKLVVISGNQKRCFSGYLRSSNGTKSGNFSGYLYRSKAVILTVIGGIKSNDLGENVY